MSQKHVKHALQTPPRMRETSADTRSAEDVRGCNKSMGTKHSPSGRTDRIVHSPQRNTSRPLGPGADSHTLFRVPPVRRDKARGRLARADVRLFCACLCGPWTAVSSTRPDSNPAPRRKLPGAAARLVRRRRASVASAAAHFAQATPTESPRSEAFGED